MYTDIVCISVCTCDYSSQEIKRQKAMVREQHKLEELRILDYVKEREVRLQTCDLMINVSLGCWAYC